jgi:dihydrofolate synthase/folylpolyglutamate synthase
MRAARYTSPHLADLTERFVIGTKPVDPGTLEAAASDVLECVDQMRERGELEFLPTFFEACTAAAFELFRRARVEVAVIEVGLGGRFDATNVIAPLAGAITSIGFDHQQHLGNTLEAIAVEKAGIIKPGMTVVVGNVPKAAMDVIRLAAGSVGATLVESSANADVEADEHEGQTTIRVGTPEGQYGPVTLALRGEHQVGNALVAIRLLESARRSGLRISRQSIEHGLSTAEWPARLELITLGDGRRLLIDAAHNVDGANALSAYLARWHPERPALVLAIMRDKDVDGIVRALLPVTSSVVATAPDTPRAIPPGELADRVAALAPDRDVEAESDAALAVRKAATKSVTVCVAGSLYLAGAVRERFKPRAILD